MGDKADAMQAAEEFGESAAASDGGISRTVPQIDESDSPTAFSENEPPSESSSRTDYSGTWGFLRWVFSDEPGTHPIEKHFRLLSDYVLALSFLTVESLLTLRLRLTFSPQPASGH